MTWSNEHPDMSGNFIDSPYFCAQCNREVREDKILMLPGDDDHFFCSDMCCEEWDEAKRDISP